jgi:hypothetical protein
MIGNALLLALAPFMFSAEEPPHSNEEQEPTARGQVGSLGKVKPAAFYCGLPYSLREVRSCYDFRNDAMSGSLQEMPRNVPPPRALVI